MASLCKTSRRKKEAHRQHRRYASFALIIVYGYCKKIINKSQQLEISINSVIKHKNNDLSYWALTHCESKADFHIRDSFTVKMPNPGVG